uniref:Variant surface glycoprotein 1125.1137 n=1 Tax=Trypanosoma brucei TaxID=5691 RepID=A0A1J0R6I8_9TRYP|nr:variant surface glycoprotein 1125.1137 [Trypanosoma brucei]
MQLASLLLLALVLAASPAAGNVAKGSNAAVYKHLCKLIQIAEATIDIPDALPDTSGSYDNLQILNASLSSEEWRQQFAKKGENQQRPDKPEGERGSDQAWTDRWQAWLKEAEAVEKDADVKDIYKILTAEPTPHSLRKTRLRQVAPAMEAAAAAANQIKQALQGKGNADKAAAMAQLQTAVFGAAGKTLSTATAAELTTHSAPQAPNPLCGSTGTSSKAKSVIALLMCICSKTDSASGIADPCTTTSSSTTEVSGTFSNLQTLLPDLVKSCSPRAKRQVTAAEILQSLDELMSQTTATTSYTTLGTFLTTNCYGHSQSGACVVYSGNVAAAKQAIEESSWYSNMKAAANTIRKIDDYNRNVSTAASTIETAMHTIVGILRTEPVEGYIAGTQTPPTSAGTEETKGKEETCLKQTSKTTCTQHGCKWDGQDDKDGKHCKLNATKVEQATQAGAGEKKDGAAATRCAKHGTDKA